MSEIAVLGAGIMGHGIALVFALGGHAVRLTDSRAETLAKAPALMASALKTLREAGEVDGSWTAEKLGAAKLGTTLVLHVPRSDRKAPISSEGLQLVPGAAGILIDGRSSEIGPDEH